MKQTFRKTRKLLLMFLVLGMFALLIPGEVNAAGYKQVYEELAPTQKNPRVKVGKYYYWFAFTRSYKESTGFELGNCKTSKCSILRAKSKTGAGKVIYKSDGVCKKNVKVSGKTSKKGVVRYEYLDIYTDGKYIIFGEQDAKTEKITFYRIGVDGKGKKKLISYKNPNYYPEDVTKMKGSGIIAICGDSIICQSSKSKGQTGDVATYKVSIKNAKKTTLSGLVATYEAGLDTITDGDYMYNDGWGQKGYALDLKSGNQVETFKVESYKVGADGTLYGMINERFEEGITTKIYPIKDAKNGESLMEFGIKLPKDTKVSMGAIKGQYVYLEYNYVPGNDKAKVYICYDVVAKDFKQISEAEYVK